MGALATSGLACSERTRLDHLMGRRTSTTSASVRIKAAIGIATRQPATDGKPNVGPSGRSGSWQSAPHSGQTGVTRPRSG